MTVPYFQGSRPRVYGHRGASAEAPENTLEAFVLAVEQGADVLELDVHGSADGVVVVHHDPTVDRMTDGSGAIRERSFASLSELDCGARFTRGDEHPFRGRGVRIPSLAALLERLPDIPMNVEIKQADPPIEEAFLAVVREHEAMDRVLIASEHVSVLERIRRLAPEAITGFARQEVVEHYLRYFSGLGWRRPWPGSALQIPRGFWGLDLVTPASVAAAHELGLEVHVWTINDRTEMERLLHLGVDAVMTDHPAVLREVVDRFVAERPA